MAVKDFKKQHIHFLKTADWDQVASAIVELEIEKYELRSFLSKKESKEYDAIIELYETKKYKMVKDITPKGGFNRYLNMEANEELDANFEISGD